MQEFYCPKCGGYGDGGCSCPPDKPISKKDFFKEWLEKYPNSFKKFIKFLVDYSFFKNSLDMLNLKLELLTGIIEKFFEDNNIDISILIYDEEYTYQLYNSKTLILFKDRTSSYFYKQEAQMSVYLKAAEMLEKELI